MSQTIPSSRTKRRDLDLGVWPAVAAGALLSWIFLVPRVDDAYIVFRYAANLVDGFGFVWNRGGPTVDGFTSPIWTALSAVALELHLQPGPAMRILGAACGLVGLVFTIKLSRRLLPDVPGSFAGLLLLVLLPWTIWAVSGMEMALAGTLVVAIALLLVPLCTERRLALAGAALGVLLLVRPDTLVVAGVAAMEIVWAAHGDWRKARRDLAWLAVPAAILFVPYFIWHLVEFGHPFPNTYYAKVSGLRA